MALIFFVFGLWSIIKSYQTNPIVAVLVFCGAAAAAFAFVMSYLMAIFGAAGFSVYGLLKVAETSQRAQRLQNGGAGGAGEREQVQHRPHYD
jgi:cytochrome bd-type quinol oxidase subunit 1